MVQGGDKVIFKELSYQVIGVIFDVYNELGYGYQEKIYERSVARRFDELRLYYDRQAYYKVAFRGKIVGRYYMDFIVDNKIVLELKRGDYFSRKHIDQVKGYLKVIGLKLALIVQFTSKGVRFIRILNPNNIKQQTVKK